MLTIDGWLSKIARNKTKDFLRSLKTVKAGYKLKIEKKTKSLSDPVSYKNEGTLEDITPSPNRDTTFEKALQQTLTDIDDIKSERDRWVMRLKIIYYESFGHEENLKLAAFLGKTVKTVAMQIDQLMNDLAAKKTKKDEAQKHIAEIENEIERLENRLKDIRSGFGDPREAEHIKKTIADRKKTLSNVDFFVIA